MRGLTIVLVAVAACYHPSAATDVPCTQDHMCPEGQMCDTSRNPPTCVSQIMPTDGRMVDMMIDAPNVCGVCGAATPVCDLGTMQCRGCLKDAECQSDVCSESTGKCVDAAAALYVASNGTAGGACTRQAPCSLPSYAITLLDATHTTIKVTDGTYTDVMLTASKSYVLSGEGNTRYGARINFQSGVTGRDHVLEIQGGTVLVEGLTFAQAAAQEDIRAQSSANVTLWRTSVLDSGLGNLDIASATVTVIESKITGGMGTESAVNVNGGQITMLRSTVDHNAGGGFSITNGAKFDIENCFITSNGGNGAFVQTGTLANPARFELDTVADNIASAGTGGGATCAAAIAFKSTIFSNNGGAPQFGATCTATYSLFTDTPPTGTGNIMASAGFVNNDYHLANGSSAIDKADPGTTIKDDIDEDVRPKGGGYDIGADEH